MEEPHDINQVMKGLGLDLFTRFNLNVDDPQEYLRQAKLATLNNWVTSKMNGFYNTLALMKSKVTQ
jgi:hypothetical protein